MSAFDNNDFQSGFPFTRGLLQAPLAAFSNHGPADVTQSAQVNSASIPDTDAHEMADTGTRADTGPKTARETPAALRATDRAGRPIPRPDGVRLLPLATFVWGTRSLPPGPRTRPDHVLIWVTGGKMQVGFPRLPHVLRPGDLRFIPAGTAFTTVPAEDTRGHVALIAPAVATGAEPPLPGQTLAVRR